MSNAELTCDRRKSGSVTGWRYFRSTSRLRWLAPSRDEVPCCPAFGDIVLSPNVRLCGFCSIFLPDCPRGLSGASSRRCLSDSISLKQDPVLSNRISRRDKYFFPEGGSQAISDERLLICSVRFDSRGCAFNAERWDLLPFRLPGGFRTRSR